MTRIKSNEPCATIEDVASVIKRMNELQALKKEVEKMLDVGKDLVKAFMKDHETASISAFGVCATLTKYNRRVFDRTAFQTDHAKMYDRYMKTESRERFTFGTEEKQ